MWSPQRQLQRWGVTSTSCCAIRLLWEWRGFQSFAQSQSTWNGEALVSPSEGFCGQTSQIMAMSGYKVHGLILFVHSILLMFQKLWWLVRFVIGGCRSRMTGKKLRPTVLLYMGTLRLALGDGSVSKWRLQGCQYPFSYWHRRMVHMMVINLKRWFK